METARIEVTTHNDKVPQFIPALAWQELLYAGMRSMLGQSNIQLCTPAGHIEDTPRRIVKMYEEIFWGTKQDPGKVLRTCFAENEYNEMIHVEAIDFVSWCSHHLLPFYGQVHFAYIPDKSIVGLSKIPRLVEVLAARPQVQERLTQSIVNVFQQVVAPKGCGCSIAATHTCMSARGVKKSNARMRTTSLTGCFMIPSVKEEFLSSVKE